ncbi:MAG: DUF2750 domain-containing protein [Parashewanella sp.]
MTDTTSTLTTFVTGVEKEQHLWALQDSTGEGWVVCDSSQFEQTDVMPLWSSEELAQKNCTDEWQDYQVASISLNDFLEFWVSDFNDDGVMVGLNWQVDGECLEIDPIELAKQLVDVEKEQH